MAASRDLRLLAGDRAFERGVEYFQEGRVLELTTLDGRTSALVEGTETYQVELWETPRGLEGSCTCPASDGFDFCKHCVAVGLALEARQAELARLAEGGPDDRIRAYLARQSSESLVEMVVRLLPDQPALRDRLSLQADIAAGATAAKDLKKRITAASPLRHIWHAREVARYFSRFEAVLEGIAEIAEGLPPEDLLAAALHGIRRLDKVLERVDDSHGARWGAERLLSDLHIGALSRISWPPQKKATHLLELILADPFDQFSGGLERYADALGEAGLTAFYTEAQARLDALPELAFGASYAEQAEHLRLAHLLEAKAEQAGDIEARIALAKRTCTSAHDCGRIAALYLEKGDADEALAWLDKADDDLQASRRDHALRAEIHRARGEWPRAIAARQALFEGRVERKHYDGLLEIAREAGCEAEVEGKARSFLREQLGRGGWLSETAAVTLGEVLLDEGNAEEAFPVIRDHVRQPRQLLTFAGRLQSEPAYACELIKGAAEALIGQKDKRSYASAVKTLKDARPLFDRLSPTAFDDCIADIRERHAPKRNLMALLKNV